MILSKLMQLPIKQWSFKSQDPSIEHVGPMAQDFHAVFALGESDTTICSIDPPGIALAAIQGLYKEQQRIIERQKVTIGNLTARLNALENMVRRLEVLTAILEPADRRAADREQAQLLEAKNGRAPGAHRGAFQR